MTIDFHAHAITKEYLDWLNLLKIDPLKVDGFKVPDWSAKDHLAFMKEAGIDFSILSSPTPHLYNGDNKQSAKANRQVNKSLSEICKEYPNKFAFVASVPLPDVKGAIKEYKYAVKKLGAVGVKLTSNSFGVYLGDPAFDDFMAELNKNNALVIIHPQRATEYPKNNITGTVAAIFEYPTDTTRAVLNMMSNKIMTRYPNIKFVVPHTGSFLPYMLQRFKGVSGILASLGMMDVVNLQEEFKNLYFDIAGDPEPVALDMLLMVADKNKIVYGSDYPHSPAKVVVAKKQHLDNNEKYKELLKNIYKTNAKKLLKGANK